MDEHDFSNNKLVPIYERITEGSRRIGSIIREVVKTRFYEMEILSEIIEYEPNHTLGYQFQGGGTVGNLRYMFEPFDDGTRLVQEVNISFSGLKKILNPLLPFTYGRKAEWRLKAIKELLEAVSARS
jgi:hypothetical protein